MGRSSTGTGGNTATRTSRHQPTTQMASMVYNVNFESFLRPFDNAGSGVEIILLRFIAFETAKLSVILSTSSDELNDNFLLLYICFVNSNIGPQCSCLVSSPQTIFSTWRKCLHTARATCELVFYRKSTILT